GAPPARVPAVRPVGQLATLAEGAARHGVLAGDGTRAEREDGDLPPAALTREPLPAVHRNPVEVAPERLGDDLRHPEGGAARGVLLEAVMSLCDLDVVLVRSEERRVGKGWGCGCEP